MKTGGTMNSKFTPKLASMASKAIRDLNSTNTKLASERTELQTKVAALEEERDCRRLAEEMADQGLIDVNDVAKTAASLGGQDLAVVKQAMTWRTPSSLNIGEPTSSGEGAGDGVDPITQACLED